MFLLPYFLLFLSVEKLPERSYPLSVRYSYCQRSGKEKRMRAVKLRTEHVTNPMGIDVRRPVLSWVCEGGIRQSAYQIMAEVSMVDGRKEFWDSG